MSVDQVLNCSLLRSGTPAFGTLLPRFCRRSELDMVGGRLPRHIDKVWFASGSRQGWRDVRNRKCSHAKDCILID